MTVPKGGVVTESGMVLDKDSGTLREVDILIEVKYAGHPFRMIVECRDHSRKQTIEWIDGLIVRTKSFDVNKVIAVSSKGFYSAAIKKAKINNIQTLTLKEANNINWGEFPIELGIALISKEFYKLINVFYKNGEEYLEISKLNLESQVQFNGENNGTLNSLIEQFYNDFTLPQIETYKKANFTKLFPTRGGLEKTFFVEIQHYWPETTILDSNRNLITFSDVKFIVAGTRNIDDIEQEHKLFNNKVVSKGIHQEIDGTEHVVTTIQDPETMNIHLHWAKQK